MPTASWESGCWSAGDLEDLNLAGADVWSIPPDYGGHMAIERRVVIGQEDVRTVILECASCPGEIPITGALVAPGIGELSADKLIRCPHCKCEWLADADGTDAKKFVAAVTTLREMILDAKAPPFRIRVEFREPR
jgi:DNA-directed RNA polymerase subunit RPC12/RpoP